MPGGITVAISQLRPKRWPSVDIPHTKRRRSHIDGADQAKRLVDALCCRLQVNQGLHFNKHNIKRVYGPFDQDFTWPGGPFFVP